MSEITVVITDKDEFECRDLSRFAARFESSRRQKFDARIKMDEFLETSFESV